MAEGAGVRRRDATLPPERATLLALVLYAALTGGTVLAFQFAWGRNPLRAAFASVGGWGVALFAVVPAAVVLHEMLHALGWGLSAGAWKAIRFGARWRRLVVYAHASAPMPARAYRLGSALPGLVMGLAPALAGLATGNAPLTGWAALFLGFAAGDVLVLWSLRGVPGRRLVADHPERAGCEVLEQEG